MASYTKLFWRYCSTTIKSNTRYYTAGNNDNASNGLPFAEVFTIISYKLDLQSVDVYNNIIV